MADIRIIKPIYKIKYVACSGGIDSMVLYSFIKRVNDNIIPVFFHHNTETSELAYDFLKKEIGNNLVLGKLSSEKPKSKSKEEWWHEERHKFLNSLDGFVGMAHHLNDVAETYIFNMTNGKDWLIPYKNKNILRPFLLTKKENLVKWGMKHKIRFIEDKSNFDTSFARNRVRKNILPEIEKINKGFLTVVRKMLEKQCRSSIGRSF